MVFDVFTIIKNTGMAGIFLLAFYMVVLIYLSWTRTKGAIMKKFMSVLGMCGVALLAACDSNAGAKNGDTVIIDFAGYLDGEKFEGGTASGFPLTLGSGQFVPGFEDQVVGMKVGETRDINITFPEQYVEGLAGKAVVFKVTVQEIKKN